MEIRRFVTMDGGDGTVAVRRDTPIADTDVARGITTLWGWDRLPGVPLSAVEVEAGLARPSLFPPSGGTNVAVIVMAPAGEPRATGGVSLANANVVHVEGDPLMHQTDTIDLIFVLEGEVTLEQPGEDADIELRRGDFLVQNGGLHKWTNRTEQPAVLAFVFATTTRAPS